MQINRELIRKQAMLTGAGIALQFLGSMCLCAASVLALKEITAQVKKTLAEIVAE